MSYRSVFRPGLFDGRTVVVNPGGPAEFAKSIDEQRAVLGKSAQELGMPEKK